MATLGRGFQRWRHSWLAVLFVARIAGGAGAFQALPLGFGDAADDQIFVAAKLAAVAKD
jgi:hypothetical protein